MTRQLYEVFPSGEKTPVDLVENYRQDVKKWGRGTAASNLVMAARIIAGYETDVHTNLSEALQDAQTLPPNRLSTLYLETDAVP